MPRSIAGRHAVVLLAAAALAVPSAALAAADDGPPIGRGAVSLPVPFDGEIDEADALRLPEGSYLVQVNAIEPYDTSIEFDLRTWLVDDPQPDDPQPAPGLVAGGDVDFLSPAEEHAFDVRFSGAGGTESLRGLIEWDGARAGNVLARSIVRVTPGQG